MSFVYGFAIFLSFFTGEVAHATPTRDPCRATFMVLSEAAVSVKADRWGINAQPVLIGCEADLDRLDATARAKLLAVFEDQLESLSFLALALNKNREIRQRWIVAPLNDALDSDVIADVFLADLSGTEYQPALPGE